MSTGSEAWTQERGNKLDLNTADAAQLGELRGVGQRRAEQIIEWRDSHGPFRSVDDLRQIEGFSDILTEDFRNAVTVGGS